MTVITNRAVSALKRRRNWVQLGQFGIVGAGGYAINLGVYTLLLGIGAHWAAAVSFVVSAANNYWWNRHWTFAHAKGHFGYQGMRFFAVSAAAFAANQLWLFLLLDLAGDRDPARRAAQLRGQQALVVPLRAPNTHRKPRLGRTS